MDETVFALSLLLLTYTYLGYPALAWARAALQPRPPRAWGIEPDVTVVLAVHDEAERITRRLENLLALEYPRDRLDIVVGSDGSTDGTADLARAFESHGVSVVAFGSRRGKPAVLNDLVPKARGAIVVLADARQRFEPAALRALVAPFADPEIGAVSGELMLTAGEDGTPVGEGVGFYWRYEKFIRCQESRAASTPGATGAIYAIRRELFEAIPDDTILDDVLIPLRIVRRGYRVVLEPRARAWDRAAATGHQEFTRKVRTIAGKFQLFTREPWLLSPWHNPLWPQTVSRIALRLLGPVLLVTALGASARLAAQPLYAAMLGVQLLFYGAALGGYLARGARRHSRWLSVPYVFCLLHCAIVAGFVRFITGRQRVTWEKATAR